MLSERLLKLPGFIYEVNGDYYFLGKWICKACTDVEATDCVVMYQMCRNAKEEPKNAGTLPLVSRWNSKVPKPANNSVAEIESPVRTGTRIVQAIEALKSPCVCE